MIYKFLIIQSHHSCIPLKKSPTCICLEVKEQKIKILYTNINGLEALVQVDS